jgi:hypothetical protein
VGGSLQRHDGLPLPRHRARVHQRVAGNSLVKQRERSNRFVAISFSVPVEVAPALRSAVEEISHTVGQRLEGSYSFAREQALTDAAEGLGALRAAVNSKVPKEDSHYGN